MSPVDYGVIILKHFGFTHRLRYGDYTSLNSPNYYCSLSWGTQFSFLLFISKNNKISKSCEFDINNPNVVQSVGQFLLKHIKFLNGGNGNFNMNLKLDL